MERMNLSYGGNRPDRGRAAKIPVECWTDNELEAFRRNRMIQTYHRRDMGDLGTQMYSSWRSRHYEVHKFRQNNAKYMPTNTDPSSTEFLKTLMNKTEREIEFTTNSGNFESESTPNMFSATNGSSINNNTANGSIPISRKNAKLSVTFSLFNDVFEDSRSEQNDSSHEFLNEKSPWTYIRQRTTSTLASKQTNVLPVPLLLERGHTDMADIRHKHLRTLSGTKRYSSRRVLKETSSEPFFNKSKASCLLQSELRRRAKQRKHHAEKIPLTTENVLTFQREQNVQSQEKVRQYLSNIREIWWTPRNQASSKEGE